MESICDYCKSPFFAKRTDSLYCSHSCRQAAYVLRKVSYSNEERVPTLSYPSRNDDASQAVEMKKKDLTDKSQDKEEEYKTYSSSFIEEIEELIADREYLLVLSSLLRKKDPAVYWVSIRYKCLLECLLCFSEMKLIGADNLKEVCNAFSCVELSDHFAVLPTVYPYTNEMLEIREKLRSICLAIEEDSPALPFTLQRITKQKFIASRWELSHHFPKTSFNQLDFDG